MSLLVIVAILPFVSTLLGGVAALRLRHRLHPIMAFAAGVLVATALVDLLPEAEELTEAVGHPFLVGGAAVLGFLAFSALEALVHRQTWEHQHPPEEEPHAPHAHDDDLTTSKGMLGLTAAAGLIVHSTLDGLAIGLGFHADVELGTIVALAVLAHDFADGMNVVTFVLAGGSGLRAAQIVLALDALAPPLGVFLSTLVSSSEPILGTLLAVFAGVFLAIGAGHLLPEASHSQPRAAPVLVVFAALGAVVVLAIRSVIS
ncbi:MAG: ZIP family metal transporter [Chloroflexi bacterium]|nr:ZIP family metal transporter [Chloroflexota bacterium]